jgi:hypothetical protein
MASVSRSKFGVGVTVEEFGDRNFKRAVINTGKLDGDFVLVGIFEGAMPNSGEGTPVAVYAALHEFGSQGGRVKEKAWMRSTLDLNREKYNRFIADGVRAVQDGSRTADGFLTELGMMVQADLRLRITELHLILTGAMRNSVAFEVHSGVGAGGAK